MSHHGLLEDHLNALQALSFVVKFAPNDVIVQLTVLAGLVAQVVKHLFWADVFARKFLLVQQALASRQHLILNNFDGLREFALLLAELGVLFLLFAQLRGSLKQGLEVFTLSLVFKQVNLG